MFKIKCEECGNVLVFDEQLSKDFIWSSDKIMYNDVDGIVEDTLRAEMVYRCPSCEKVYHLDYKNWDRLARKQMSKEVMEMKRMLAYKSARTSIVDEDDGLAFCGYCPGFDDLGNCFTTIIDKCKLRREKIKQDEL